MIAVTPYYFSTLPWSSGEDENRYFKRLVLITLVLTVVLAALVFFVEVPEQTREEKAKIPPQLSKILEAEDPPVAELPEPEPEPDPVLDKPEPEPEPKPEPEPEPEPAPRPPSAHSSSSRLRGKYGQGTSSRSTSCSLGQDASSPPASP